LTRYAICGAEVLRNASHDRPERRDVWIEGGKIAALTPPGASHWPDADVLDASGMLAIPGLVNGHTHSQSALLQGSIKGEPLDIFVIRAIARRVPRSTHTFHVGATLHAMAMLKRGITAHIDHLRDGLVPTVEGVEAVLRAYRDIGIRAMVAPMYEDRVYLDSLPIDQAALPETVRNRLSAARRPPPEEYFSVMEELTRRWRGAEGRLDLLLGVDGPQRCTTRLLEMTGEFATRHRMGLHTHLLEAKTQHLMAPAEHGGSFVRYLDGFGLINERSSLAHFVWCTPEDIALAAERCVNVVHNPVSNLALGSGIQPAARLVREGVNVALGTDGQNNSAVSILEQAKLASLLSRVCDTDPRRWLDLRAVFRMATEAGAKLLGLGGEAGVIEAGARADIALIDVTGPAWQPRGDLYTHLVLHESGTNVRHVLVEGEVVVRDGRCVRVDEAAVMEEACAIGAEIVRGIDPSLDRDTPHVMRLLIDALDKHAQLNRFADLR
jgi:cytosine/adenosine deaminase-related metal-dependent hydrolase